MGAPEITWWWAGPRTQDARGGEMGDRLGQTCSHQTATAWGRGYLRMKIGSSWGPPKVFWFVATWTTWTTEMGGCGRGEKIFRNGSSGYSRMRDTSNTYSAGRCFHGAPKAKGRSARKLFHYLETSRLLYVNILGEL